MTIKIYYRQGEQIDTQNRGKTLKEAKDLILSQARIKTLPGPCDGPKKK